MKQARPLILIAAFAAATLTLSCKSGDAQDHPAGHDGHVSAWKTVTKAICVIRPTKGNEASGVVVFSQEGGKVKVVAEIEGLEPGKKHGFHIHEWGDVSGDDGKTAGGHYNPEGHDHAGPDKSTRHAGDLGNLTADAQGRARLELSLDNLTIADLRNPIIGRGMIVHAGEDDLKSQPTGAAGARIGYGVIGIAKP